MRERLHRVAVGVLSYLPLAQKLSYRAMRRVQSVLGGGVLYWVCVAVVFDVLYAPHDLVADSFVDGQRCWTLLLAPSFGVVACLAWGKGAEALPPKSHDCLDAFDLGCCSAGRVHDIFCLEMGGGGGGG